MGQRLLFKDDVNINPFTIYSYPKYEEGIYFTQDINDSKSYIGIIEYSVYNYRVVCICRLNPKIVRKENRGLNKDYMIINGDKIDDMPGAVKINDVRPYKILLIKE